MAKSMFDGNPNSKYDAGLIAKEVHDYFGQSIRTIDTRSLINHHFSHFRATYDGTGKPLDIKYYRGSKAHATTFDVVYTPLLSGAYFTLRSAPDNALYAVWYNLDGNSSRPLVAGAKYIEVPITSGDSSSIVAASTAITINFLNKDSFKVTRNGANLEILTVGLGLVDDSDEASTPFTFTQVSGAQDLVERVQLTYDGADPIYQGQVLKNYNYDIYSGKFVKNPEISVAVNNVGIADSDGDKLQVNPDGSLNVNVVSTGQVLKSYFSEKVNVATGVTEELVKYIAPANVYLQKVEFSGTNIASFELTIDGVTQDKKKTFFNGNLENLFNFNAGLNLLAGQTVRVYVVHDRPDMGSFNARLQILE